MTLLQLAIKRGFDVGLALLGLVLLSPIFLVLAILVHVGSAGPTLIYQQRVGRGGRIFTLYKFRTMHAGGGELYPKAKDLTWLGRHARRWGLDELPQLVNVLRGDMSFFGARRPLLPAEHQVRFGDMSDAVCAMRPAIISFYGLMTHQQGSGHEVFVSVPALEYDQQAINMVQAYQNNWHLGRDFALVFRTVRTTFAMIRRRI